MDDEGPRYIKTKEIPKVSVPSNTLDAVLSELREMRIEGQVRGEKVDRVYANVEVLTNHVDVLTGRVTLVERRLDHAEERGSKHSVGLARGSQTDEQHSAAIASVISRLNAVESNQASAAKERAETAAKVAAIHDSVVGVIRHPKVIFVGKTLFAMAMAYAAAKGIKVLP